MYQTRQRRDVSLAEDATSMRIQQGVIHRQQPEGECLHFLLSAQHVFAESLELGRQSAEVILNAVFFQPNTEQPAEETSKPRVVGTNGVACRSQAGGPLSATSYMRPLNKMKIRWR